MSTSRYSIVESVGSAIQTVNTFDDLEKHHPSSGQEAGRDYETIDGDLEEIRKTSDGRILVKKDFVLLVNGSNANVPVPCPISGYVKTKAAYGTVSIYDTPGGKLIGQVLHLSTNFKVKDGDYVEYGQPIGIQSGTGAAGTVTYAIHAHVELEKDQFIRYIADIASGAIIPGEGMTGNANDGPPYQFPVRKADGSHFQTEELFKALEKETSGHYLLGNHGFWHGGIHFSERSMPHCRLQQAIRCIADGEVVAYRLNRNYLSSMFTGDSLCSQLQYSTSFCLVRHQYESAKRPPEPEEKPKIVWTGRTLKMVAARNARDVAGKSLGKTGNFEGLMPAGTELQIISMQDKAIDGFRFANAKITKGTVSGKDNSGKPATLGVGSSLWFAALDKSGAIIKNQDKKAIFTDTTPPPPPPPPKPKDERPQTNTLTFYSLYMHLLPYEQFPSREREFKRRVNVTAQALNVRSEANLTAEPLGQLVRGAELEVVSSIPAYRKKPADTVTYELALVQILSKGAKKAGKLTAKTGDFVWVALRKVDGAKVDAYTADLPRQTLSRPAYWKGKVKARLKRRLPAFYNEQDEDKNRIGNLAENSELEYHTDTLKRVIRNGRPQIMAACTIVNGGFWDKPICPTGPIWVAIDKISMELKPEAPTDFDSVVTCNIPIRAGDPISYLGLYETPASAKGDKNSLHQVHVEVFSADQNLDKFLDNAAQLKDGAKYLRVVKGKSIHTKGGTEKEPIYSPSGQVIGADYTTELGSVPTFKGADGKEWYGLKIKTKGNPIQGFIAKQDGEVINQHERRKLGFRVIEEANSMADGFCDPQDMPPFFKELYGEINAKDIHTAQVTSSDLSLALKDRNLRDRWSRLVAVHPTEWQAKSGSEKWQRLEKLLEKSPELLRHEKERIDNLVWWDEASSVAGFPTKPTVHHFHPVALIDNLIIKETVESDFMYFARTLYGEARGQNYASKVAVAWIIRNRLATERWGKTYRSVVTARLQFTCWSQKIDPEGFKAIHNPKGSAWEDCQKAALEVMNASASANVLPDALYYYSPTAQAQLHAAKPDIYPETPPFAISSKRVANPPGVSDADYRFYKN